MRLLLAAGRLDIDRALSEISAKDVAWWEAFEEVDGPIGEQRADLRAGIIAASIVNMLRDRKSTAAKPIDFMPFAERPQQTQDQMLNVFKMFAAQQEAVTKSKPGEVVRREKL